MNISIQISSQHIVARFIQYAFALLISATLLMHGSLVAAQETPPEKTAAQVDREKLFAEHKELSDQYQALLKENKLKEAIPILEKKLALEKQLTGGVHNVVAGSLDDLAALHQETGNLAKSIEATKQQIEVLKKLYAPSSWQNREAESDLNDRVAISNFSAEQSIKLAEAKKLHSQAIELFQAKKLAEAIDMEEKVLKIRLELLPESISTSDTLNVLSFFQEQNGNLIEAISSSHKSLRIRRELYGAAHPEYFKRAEALADRYGALAGRFEGKMEYRKAGEAYTEQMILRADLLGSTADKTIDSKNALLKVVQLSLMSKEDHAKYEESLKIFDEAVKLHKAEKYEEAIKLALKGIELEKAVLTEKSATYASSTRFCAELYILNNELEKAIEYYEIATKLREEILGESHVDYIISLDKLSELVLETKNYTKAEPLLIKSYESIKSIGATEPLSKKVKQLVSLYEAQEKPSEIIKWQKELIELQAQIEKQRKESEAK